MNEANTIYHSGRHGFGRSTLGRPHRNNFFGPYTTPNLPIDDEPTWPSGQEIVFTTSRPFSRDGFFFFIINLTFYLK